MHRAYWAVDPDQIGGLNAWLDTLDMEPATIPLDGCGRTANGSESLGLRIRLKDGTEAVTTATHAHVKHPGARSMVDWVLRWAHTIKKTLLRLTTR